MWENLFLVFLMAAAVQDFIRKQVDLWIFLVFGALAAGCCVFLAAEGKTWELGNRLAGLGLGLGLLAVGALSRGRVGLGDGSFFAVSGLMLGFRENLALLCGSIFLCGLFSMACLVWSRMKGETGQGGRAIPFLPFAAAAKLGIGILGQSWR